ncbi:MAG: hypothetical protein AUF65_00860 [Chloroflexi bacterium 13_1_20CM_50_12]|nr:MAG: hypothetical protein AUF65_00860 [Chloroflexi bacterium 13_1_20CM_50_12]
MKQTSEFTPDAIKEETFSGLPAPRDFHIIEHHADGLAWERLVGERITVIESVAVRSDGKRWLQVSVAKPNKHKMPTYDDVQLMRKLFIGEDRESYMVFPPKDRYVNINPVLHLFCCLNEPDGVLPHFEGIINGKMTI